MEMATMASGNQPVRPLRRGYSISADAASVLASLAMTVGTVYFFKFAGHEEIIGVLTPDRYGTNMAWIAIAYLFVQIPTAVLSQFSWNRWFRAVVDIGSSFLPVIALIALLASKSVTWDKAEVFAQLLLLTGGEAILSIVLALIVNSRFGLLQGPTFGDSGHH